MIRSLIVVAFLLGVSSAVLAGETRKAIPQYDINKLHLFTLVEGIVCNPHEPETTSRSTPQTAIRDGDAAMAAGHCEEAIADYQVAVDANPPSSDAMWHEDIVDLAQVRQTSDAKIASDIGENAYRVADLAVKSQPNNPLFLELRSDTRLLLLPLHVAHRSPFTVPRYVKGELGNSYDDLTQAIALSPIFGEAYASRWLIDLRRNDREQATFDLAQAYKFNPESAREFEAMEQQRQELVARLQAERARQEMYQAEAMMGLAAAASGGSLIIEERPAP